MKYYLDVLRKYATFTGRARRSEYWYFVLFNFIATIIASLIDELAGTGFLIDTRLLEVPLQYGYVYVLYEVFVIIPGLAVFVRRLHDVGKSGWFFFLAFIPLIGAIWLLVLLFTDSKVGENKYGPNPKGIGNNAEIDEIGSYLAK